MAEKAGKIEGWGVFDHLKELPHVVYIEGDINRTPVKETLPMEVKQEEMEVQETPAPQEQQKDLLSDYLNVTRIESGERGEDFESMKDDGALSNRDLLYQLYAIAVGIRDFDVFGTKPKLTQLVEDVKDKRVRARKSASDNSSKSKKATSKVKEETKSKEIPGIQQSTQRTQNFSDHSLDKANSQSNVTQSSEKSNSHSVTKKSFKARPAITKQPTPLSMDDVDRLAKEARQTELGVDTEERLATRKKARVSAKNMVNQRIRALSLKRRRLSEAAVAELAAAKVQGAAARTEMGQLLEEIRGVTKDWEKDNYDDLPLEVTGRWIAAHAKQLYSLFDYHCSVIRHILVPTKSSI